jgi:hypothetical protein
VLGLLAYRLLGLPLLGLPGCWVLLCFLLCLLFSMGIDCLNVLETMQQSHLTGV